MTPQEIINFKNDQLHFTQNQFGLNPLQNTINEILKQSRNKLNLSEICKSTFEITKTLSHKWEPPTSWKAMLTQNAITAQLEAFQKPKMNQALFGLTSSLAEIAKSNTMLSDNLSRYVNSQLILSNSLTEYVKDIKESHLNKFNAIDIAMQGISKSYLKQISYEHEWEEINVAKEANDTITNIVANNLNNTSGQLTQQDLIEFRKSIIEELSNLLTKTKTEKAKQFITDLITMICFILTLYATKELMTDKSNNEVLNETKIAIQKSNEEFYRKIEIEMNKLNKRRIANSNVNLRYSTSQSSKIIGLVKSGQIVTVIEIRKKYLLVSYTDMISGEPKSGFVVKKYFDLDNN